MAEPAIRVENLGKQYRLGQLEPYKTLRDAIVKAAKAPFRHGSSPRPRAGDSYNNSVGREYIWALRNVSFEVQEGEVVGIIGSNGAGKTTLLKILTRITDPTEGRAEIRGRVGSLLEVGTGFHPELTGRENIYLNGAILGMTKAEIGRKFDEIVDFSGVEKFIDTPVKRYSSGMYVRLAFAVAAHLETEILLVDEVLAVGDAEFQKKCLGKMGDVAKEGRTVLFVSHNMAAVHKLCPRALLIQEGRLNLDSDSPTVIRQYMGNIGRSDGRINFAGRRRSPKHVAVVDAWIEKDGIQIGSLLFGDAPDVVMQIEVKEPVLFSVELILRQQDGIPVAFAPSGLAYDWELQPEPGLVTVRAHLPPLRYARGTYSIDVILADTGKGFFDYVESAICFSIESAAIGERNWSFSQTRGQGFELWDVRFSMDDSKHLSG